VTYADRHRDQAGPMPAAGRQVRLEPARRALAQALADIGRDHTLTRGDEIELLAQALNSAIGSWRKGRG
jgi:hypothetical protein